MRKGLAISIISIIICISVLNELSLICISSPMGWSNDIQLTNNTNNSVIPEIAVWDKYVHIFWCEQIPGPGSEYDLLYRRSTNGGKTWDSTIKLIDTPYHAINPSVANNQNITHLVWTDDRNSWLSAIYYMRSEDNGTTWNSEINISTPNGGTYEADIGVWGNNIYVVYSDGSYGINGFQLYFVKSEDNGNTWTTPKNITSKVRDSCHPRIAVNGSNIHVVWMDHYDKNGQGTAGAIFYMNSTDSGLTWSEDINLTPMNLDASYSDIVTNGDTIHIVFNEQVTGIWKTHYRRSENNGVSWSEDIPLSELDSDVYSSPKIAISGNNLHVVWGDNRDGKWEIYYKNSSDNGYTWSEDIRLTFDDVGSATPSIASWGNKINIAWRDDRNGYLDIFYKHYPVPFPSTNLTIDIWESNLTLNWTAPQNSPSPVSHYHIYRSTTWDGFDFLLPWVNTSLNVDPIGGDVLPLRTSWNLTGALGDESANYFYIVRAIDAEGWNDTNTNIVGKFVIPMKRGWNLISLPLVQRNTSISKVLETIDGNYNVIWVYDAEENRWRSSTTDLTDINRTMGLWIHMKNRCNLSIIGAVPKSTDITLYESWNLVGYPSLVTRNPNDALNTITWHAVQHYDASDQNDPWKHNSTNKPDGLNDLKEMKPGYGYWVYVTINDTWVRTRTIEDDKIIVWKVDGLKEKKASIYSNNPLIEYPLKDENKNYLQTDVIPEEPVSKNEYNRIDVSSIHLIFLIVLIFIGIKLISKRQSPPKKRAEQVGENR